MTGFIDCGKGLGLLMGFWEQCTLKWYRNTFTSCFWNRRPTLSPYCDSVRTAPLQLTCRQDQLAVAVCNLQKFPHALPQEYQVQSGEMQVCLYVCRTLGDLSLLPSHNTCFSNAFFKTLVILVFFYYCSLKG